MHREGQIACYGIEKEDDERYLLYQMCIKFLGEDQPAGGEEEDEEDDPFTI